MTKQSHFLFSHITGQLILRSQLFQTVIFSVTGAFTWTWIEPVTDGWIVNITKWTKLTVSTDS